MTNIIEKAAKIYTDADKTISANNAFLSSSKETRLGFVSYLFNETGLDDITKNSDLLSVINESLPALEDDQELELKQILKIISASISQFIVHDQTSLSVSKTYLDNDASGNNHYKVTFSFKTALGSFSFLVSMVETHDHGGFEWLESTGHKSVPRSFTLNGEPSPDSAAKSRIIELLSPVIESVCVNDIETDVKPSAAEVEQAEDIIAKYAPVVAMIKSLS